MTKRVMLANRSLSILESVWQDVRYACRRALREPAIAATAVLTIAVSIGFNTALFTAITSVLLRPLPYQDPDRLVAVHEMSPSRPQAPPGKMVITREEFLTWRDTSRSFQDMAASELAVYNPRVRFVLGGEPDTIRLSGAAVTPNLFRLLGVRAEVGRTLVEADGTPGHDKVAVLGYAIWRERFGGDRAVVGQTVRLSDDTYTIVGVMPQSFKFTYPERTDVWIPVVLETAPRGAVL